MSPSPFSFPVPFLWSSPTLKIHVTTSQSRMLEGKPFPVETPTPIWNPIARTLQRTAQPLHDTPCFPPCLPYVPWRHSYS